jgi:hypothetical protein
MRKVLNLQVARNISEMLRNVERGRVHVRWNDARERKYEL